MPHVPHTAFVQYGFVSIQIASMGVLGEQLRAGEGEAAQRLLSSSLGLAAIAGLLACIAMVCFPENLIVLTGVKDPQVVSVGGGERGALSWANDCSAAPPPLCRAAS